MRGLISLVGASLSTLHLSSASAETQATNSALCHGGVYRLSDGSLVDVAPDGKDLRWRTLAGETGRLSKGTSQVWVSYLGWTKQPDGKSVAFGPCGSGQIKFSGRNGQALALATIDTTFRSGPEKLKGRLVLPKGAGTVPIMVVGHGSERHSALEQAFRQRLYPANGVGVFVYDKRGTGSSSGKYTQDFEVLAGDAAAALSEAKRLAGRRAGRVGFQGGSQAGWVLPLAAQKVAADFVIVGYGIAVSPLVEDRTETLRYLQAAGWNSAVLAKAREVTDATGAVMASRFTSGYDRLNAVVAKYRSEPWFNDLKGEFTGDLVKYPEAILRSEGPKRDEGTTWNFDAVGSLQRLRAPLLWMIAAEDSEGPSEETTDNLLSLQAAGKPFTIAVFPATEHGIHLFRLSPSGNREETGYAPGYFQMEIDFAKRGMTMGSYGKAQVRRPRR